MRLHIRFNGHSDDLDLAPLELGRDASDNELRAALAHRYWTPATTHSRAHWHCW
ncbi:MAG: hypothetical protein ABI901_06035 [Roseiflexaceae bacterium]